MTDSYRDITTEWRALSALLEPSNIEWINRISPALFTGDRINVFYAMQKAYIQYGEIVYEAISYNLEGKVPGELFSAQGANIRAAVDELARLAKKRQAKRTAAELNELADQFDPSLDAIQSALLFDPILAEEDSSLQIGAQSLLADLHQKRSGNYKFAKTGLRFLDSSMGGEYKPKTLVIYAGSGGTGKTTLVAQSMLAMAEGYDLNKECIVTPSLFISLEMAKEDLLIKWLGNKLNIDTARIQSGKLESEEYDLIEQEMIRLQQLPMYVIDTSNITLAKMVYEIRKHVYNKGVRVVFVDYLQIVNHSPTGIANNDLGEFALAMKALAKRENITVFILSQLTVSNGTTKIRDTGEADAIADVIFKGFLEVDEPGAIKNVSIDRSKNRLGPTGKTAVLFNGPYQRFEEAIYDGETQKL